VKQHLGSIEVDTQPGEYTEIRIVLPRARLRSLLRDKREPQIWAVEQKRTSDGVRLTWDPSLLDGQQRREIGGCFPQSLVRVRRALMRYKPKSSAALHVALGGLPAQMPVKVDADIEVTAKTVGQLRKVTA
jgi:hypothetical protein